MRARRCQPMRDLVEGRRPDKYEDVNPEDKEFIEKVARQLLDNPDSFIRRKFETQAQKRREAVKVCYQKTNESRDLDEWIARSEKKLVLLRKRSEKALLKVRLADEKLDALKAEKTKINSEIQALLDQPEQH